jgi:hypothetical protein
MSLRPLRHIWSDRRTRVSSSTPARNKASLAHRECGLDNPCAVQIADTDRRGNAGYNVSKAAVKTFTEQRE